MELTVMHLYPDFMSLYGEYANVAVLRRHLKAMDVTVTVQAVTGTEDPPEFEKADLIYMGAGTERKQKIALQELQPVRRGLKAAVEQGTLLLFTGNAMEILGASVTDSSGKCWTGLELAEFTTVESDRRTAADAVATPVLWDAPAVGFMNKCSVTYGVTTPLFKELPLGFGNDAEHGAEGYMSGSIFATHITGPVLVKNPDFIDLLIRRMFERRGWVLPEKLPVLPHEREAYAVTLKELQGRIT